MTQWKKIMKSFGFSDSEATIYIVSLEMGPSTVQHLAKRAKISRVTTYAVIESLSAIGLMSSAEKGKKRLFVAESPERLVSFVYARVKSMEATLKEVEGSMHELKMIQRGERPVVKLFEGQEALKAILDDVVLTKPRTIDEFGNLDEILNVYSRDELRGYFQQFDKFAHKNRGFVLAEKEEAKPGHRHIEMTVLPAERFHFAGDVFVYGDKVALSTFRGKQISILIESKDIADTIRAMFDYISSCKKTNK